MARICRLAGDDFINMCVPPSVYREGQAGPQPSRAAAGWEGASPRGRGRDSPGGPRRAEKRRAARPREPRRAAQWESRGRRPAAASPAGPSRPPRQPPALSIDIFTLNPLVGSSGL